MESIYKAGIIKIFTYFLAIFLIVIFLLINYVYKIINIYVLIAFLGFSFVCYLSYKSAGDIEKIEPIEKVRILTTTEARIEINNHLSKANNFRKMINWESRKGFHASTKNVHENGKDKTYYGVIANLYTDFGKPLAEKIRVIWSLTDNEEYKVDILSADTQIIDPFFSFSSFEIKGGFKKAEQSAPNTAIYLDNNPYGDRKNVDKDKFKDDQEKVEE